MVQVIFLPVTEQSIHIDPGGDDALYTLYTLIERSLSYSETSMSHYIRPPCPVM